MNRTADLVFEPILWSLADWSLRWGVLIGMLAAWLFVFRPRRTATRYLVCWMVLLAGLCLPLLPRFGPGIPLAVSLPKELSLDANVESASRTTTPIDLRDDKPHLHQLGAQATGAHTDPSLALRAGNASSTETHVVGELETPRAAEPLGARRVVVLGIAAVWVVGFSIYLLRWAAGCWLLGCLRRSAVSMSGRPAAIFADCVSELAVRRPIELAAHPRARSPFSLGLFRPIVIVPSDWSSRSEHVQRSSLLHEIAHLARYDDWLALFMEGTRAVFWFHPLVRWLLARIERESELRCDETAVSRGIDPREYAQVLLDFARQPGRLLPAAVASPSYPLRIGRGRTVKARIEHLLEDNMQRWITPMSRGRAVALAITVMVIAAGVGCAKVRTATAPAGPQVEKNETPGPVGPVTALDEKPTGRVTAVTSVAPKEGHFVQSFDVLKIDKRSPKTEPRLDLSGIYLVEPDGDVYLGPAYGRVKVNAMYLDQAKQLVRYTVGKIVKDADVSVTVVGRVTAWRNDPTRQRPYLIRPHHQIVISGSYSPNPRLVINGRYVVDSDGSIDLKEFYGGRFKVAGLTLRELNDIIQARVNAVLDEQEIAVTLGGWEELWQRLGEENKKPSDAPEVGRHSFRYDGKGFEQCRHELLTELKPENRVDGIKAMGEFGANGYWTEAAQVVLEVLSGLDAKEPGDQADQKAVFACRVAIEKIGPKAAPVIIRGLNDGNRNLRRATAAVASAVQSPEMIAPILRAMKDEDPLVRRRAVGASVRVAGKATDVLGPLTAALGDADHQVRSAAVQAVHSLKSEAKSAVPTLVQQLKEEKHENVIKQIIGALRDLGPDASSAVTALIEITKRENPDIVSMAADALRTVEADRAKIVPAFIEMVKSQNPAIRKTACTYIGQLGADAKAAVPTLINVLDEGHQSDWFAAIQALGNIGPAAKDALPVLRRLGEAGGDPVIHNAAIAAIRSIDRSISSEKERP